ncbi:hypothetical protein [Desulfobacter sp.]|uniref:hypothetical protein n=1 Tax=Desulfobacter sp. TaxID=2294 RepID=UPI003D0E8084
MKTERTLTKQMNTQDLSKFTAMAEKIKYELDQQKPSGFNLPPLFAEKLHPNKSLLLKAKQIRNEILKLKCGIETNNPAIKSLVVLPGSFNQPVWTVIQSHTPWQPTI